MSISPPRSVTVILSPTVTTRACSTPYHRSTLSVTPARLKVPAVGFVTRVEHVELVGGNGRNGIRASTPTP
jgi:hypothetical protein